MPVVSYSDDYDDVVNKAKRDVARNYKPEIKPLSVNLSDYDTIIIGTPTWWYKMASPVLTFMSALCKSDGAEVFATQEIQFGTRARAGTLVSKQEVIDDFIEKILEKTK